MEGVVFPELSPAEQAEAVKRTEKENNQAVHEEGDQMFLISSTWFNEWRKYT